MHPVAIGAFALGAVALAIAAVFIFGANKLFARKFPIVMFFDENVNGLTVGAPVSYRGLRLGQVTAIQSPVGSPRIAVAANLERGPLLTRRTAAGVSADQMRQTLEEAIAQGLRAQLSLQSLLTGQLYVSLVLRPDTAAVLAGLGGAALEIPTIPTIIAQLETGLTKVPLAQVPKYLSDTLEGSARLLQDPELAKTLEAAGPLVADARKLMQRLDAEAGPLLRSLKATSDTAQKALAQLGPELGALAVKLEGLSEAARGTLDKADSTLSGDLPLGHQLQRTLQDLGAAARSLRSLADSLERNPESLLAGKPGPQTR
jgi:paraquat-inducible protein B